MKKQITIFAIATLVGLSAQAKSIRATEMKSSDWATLKQNSQEELLLEFREGDEILVAIKAGGDLIEIRKPVNNVVSVKKDFWIRIQNNVFQFSLDGQSYKPLTDSLRGNLTIDTDDSGNFAVGLDTLVR